MDQHQVEQPELTRLESGRGRRDASVKILARPLHDEAIEVGGSFVGAPHPLAVRAVELLLSRAWQIARGARQAVTCIPALCARSNVWRGTASPARVDDSMADDARKNEDARGGQSFSRNDCANQVSAAMTCARSSAPSSDTIASASAPRVGTSWTPPPLQSGVRSWEAAWNLWRGDRVAEGA